MSAPKLTESQRNTLQFFADGSGLFGYPNMGTVHALTHRDLLSLNRGGERTSWTDYSITDAGRAVLKDVPKLTEAQREYQTGYRMGKLDGADGLRDRRWLKGKSSVYRKGYIQGRIDVGRVASKGGV